MTIEQIENLTLEQVLSILIERLNQPYTQEELEAEFSRYKAELLAAYQAEQERLEKIDEYNNLILYFIEKPLLEGNESIEHLTSLITKVMLDDFSRGNIFYNELLLGYMEKPDFNNDWVYASEIKTAIDNIENDDKIAGSLTFDNLVLNNIDKPVKPELTGLEYFRLLKALIQKDWKKGIENSLETILRETFEFLYPDIANYALWCKELFNLTNDEVETKVNELLDANTQFLNNQNLRIEKEERKKLGMIARKRCEDALDCLAGWNLQRTLTQEQITTMIETYENVDLMLRKNRPTVAASLINDINPDGVITTQEMKNEILAILNGEI